MTPIFLTARNDTYNAKAEYDNGIITVLPGSRIRLDFASHIRGGRKALSYRNDPEYVDKNGIVLKKCAFSSASTAAQFVTGRSVNGLQAWHVEKKINLKEWLENQ